MSTESMIQADIFSDYPDIVSVDDLMKMLHIGRNSAYKLLQSTAIKHFKVGKIYKIPKVSVCDYIIVKNSEKH